MIVAVLGSGGYEVTTAGGSEDGLRLARESGFDRLCTKSQKGYLILSPKAVMTSTSWADRRLLVQSPATTTATSAELQKRSVSRPGQG
jgi:hypothetical protein